MRRRDRQSSQPAPARPRVLAHVVHYFGAGSEFVGKSTTAVAEERRAKVERVLAGLRALPYDVEVAVCGVPDSSLVPVDVDLSSEVTDPRHLAYAAIRAMADRIGEHDYFLCLEDDVLVPADAVERMIRFTQHAQLNEVLLPNRLERAEGGATYCVDLLAMPGWHGLSRRFEGQRLGVAVNPHSGLAFLSRKQLRYAARRVDLARRDQFLGGYMASALANLHQPFLLWRTLDEEAHHVEHLDHWIAPTVRLSLPATDVRVAPDGARGRIDEIRIDGVVAHLRGWLAAPDGAPAAPATVRLGEVAVAPFQFESESRPDVHAAFPSVSADCGFTATLSLLDVPAEAVGTDTVTILADAASVSSSWPGGTAAWARSNAPEIPDMPFMPERGIARVSELLAASSCYLEYGTGGTSVLAARTGVPLVYCVESDESWLAAVAAKLRDLPTSTRFVLCHADIGPTGPWGYPATTPVGTASGDYALAVWDRIRADEAQPDLVLVDGRYRVACFLASLLHGRPGTRILFDDYTDRDHYATVEAVLKPDQRHERVAEFVVPASFDRELAWALLARHAGDTR